MQVIAINPHGFCEGVVKAVALAEKARREHPDEPIYVLGLLVHNEEVIAHFEKENFIFFDESQYDLAEALGEIPNGSVLVFSAHGHAPRLEAKAQAKHLVIYDATCPFVKENAVIIANEVTQGGEVLYIGKKKHAESVAALQIDPARVHLLDPALPNEKSWGNLTLQTPLVVSQTTMDLDDLALAKNWIKSRYPAARFADERCHATVSRQRALWAAPSDIDLYVILGSKRSNNTNKLVAIAEKSYPHAQIVQALNEEELRSYDFRGKKKAALASGASTSPATFEACKAYLEGLK